MKTKLIIKALMTWCVIFGGILGVSFGFLIFGQLEIVIAFSYSFGIVAFLRVRKIRKKEKQRVAWLNALDLAREKGQDVIQAISVEGINLQQTYTCGGQDFQQKDMLEEVREEGREEGREEVREEVREAARKKEKEEQAEQEWGVRAELESARRELRMQRFAMIVGAVVFGGLGVLFTIIIALGSLVPLLWGGSSH